MQKHLYVSLRNEKLFISPEHCDMAKVWLKIALKNSYSSRWWQVSESSELLTQPSFVQKHLFIQEQKKWLVAASQTAHHTTI